MQFDLLAIASALLAVRALQVRRPATFFLLANQFLVCRAFSRIETAGPPLSLSYLPQFLFSEHQLGVAKTMFLITTSIMFVFTCLGNKSRTPASVPVPAVPRWLLIVASCYVVLLAASSKTILEGAYSDMERYRFQVDLVGGGVLIFSLLLFEIVRRVLVGSLTGWKGLGIIFAMFFATYFLKGGTGLATGYVFCAAVMMLGRQNQSRTPWITLLVIGVSLAALTSIIRSVRPRLHLEGFGAITQVLTEGLADDDGLDTTTPTGLVEGNLNGIQAAAHVLMCIGLWENGIGRDWRSVTDVVEYTFKPRILADQFGWTRSIDAPWELRDNFFHWGGINIIGEFYWNGGYLCVVVMWSLVSLFAFMCDTRWQHSFTWLVLLCNFGPTLLMGAGYGFNQTARGAINGVIVLIAYSCWKKLGSGVTSSTQPVRDARTAAPPLETWNPTRQES